MEKKYNPYEYNNAVPCEVCAALLLLTITEIAVSVRIAGGCNVRIMKEQIKH